MLLVMSVRTGFGGQPFIPGARQGARARADDRRTRPRVEIEIDGGIKIDNAQLAADAGVDILVSGTGIFGADTDRRGRAIREPCAARPGRDDPAGQGAHRLRRCRGGTRDDKSGARWSSGSPTAGTRSSSTASSPTASTNVAAALRELTDGFAGLVVTTGGTGFGRATSRPKARAR